MSTHDYSLSNQSGASFRSDLNNCLAAILSNNSNGSAPSTTVAYSIWADTTAGKLKIRNAANDGFVDLINLDGTIQRDVSLTGDLTLTDKIIHSGDTNTAIRFPADDTFAVETAGSESFRIDSSQRLLLGTTTARAVGGETNPRLHIEGSGSTSNSWINLTRFQAGTGSANFQFAKSRSDTPGTYTVVQNGDTLGQISFLGSDGTDMANYAATIKAQVDGTPGSNDMPGRLTFSTTSDGGSSSTEAMRINSSQNLGIGLTNPLCKLHIKGVSGTDPTVQIDHSNADVTGEFLRIGRADLNTIRYHSIKAKHSGAAVSNTLSFHLHDGSGDPFTGQEEVLSLQGDGQVIVKGTLPAISLYDTAATNRFAYIDGNSGNLTLHADKGGTGDSSTFKVAIDNNVELTINHNGMITFANSSQSPYNLTTVSAANAVITTLHALARSTSSRKYKTNITTLTDALADKILSCNPVSYNSLCDSDDKTKVHYGLIAEEVDKIDQSLCFYNNAETPEPEGVQYDRFIPALINLIKRQKTQIETLETKVAAIEAA